VRKINNLEERQVKIIMAELKRMIKEEVE